MISKLPISRSFKVESVPLAFDGFCKDILSDLEEHKFNNEDIFAVHLSLEEAFINAVKHGNKMDSGKAVQIDYSLCPDKIEISVTDEGEGFNPDSIADPRNGDNIFKSNGRGLFLIRSYMDIVEFNECGNQMRMVRIKKHDRGEETE